MCPSHIARKEDTTLWGRPPAAPSPSEAEVKLSGLGSGAPNLHFSVSPPHIEGTSLRGRLLSPEVGRLTQGSHPPSPCSSTQ